MPKDSPNKTPDSFPRPEGKCKDCARECQSDRFIVFCSSYRKRKNKEVR
jgi:hypothetical protein